jgi:hypothetical protein
MVIKFIKYLPNNSAVHLWTSNLLQSRFQVLAYYNTHTHTQIQRHLIWSYHSPLSQPPSNPPTIDLSTHTNFASLLPLTLAQPLYTLCYPMETNLLIYVKWTQIRATLNKGNSHKAKGLSFPIAFLSPLPLSLFFVTSQHVARNARSSLFG